MRRTVGLAIQFSTFTAALNVHYLKLAGRDIGPCLPLISQACVSETVHALFDERRLTNVKAIIFAVAALTAMPSSPSLASVRTPASAISEATADRLAHGEGWEDIQPITDFHDIITHGTAASKTTCRFAYSSAHLLVKCTASEIVAKAAPASDPAKIQKGDYIAIAVSTSKESKKPGTAIFIVNPKGLNGYLGSYSPENGNWQSSVEATPISWTATFDIPLASLYRPEKPFRQLRASVFRNDTTAHTAFIWPFIPNADPMDVYGQADLSAAISP